jgi:hypothetical protein
MDFKEAVGIYKRLRKAVDAIQLLILLSSSVESRFLTNV